jgi:hypothetical protein
MFQTISKYLASAIAGLSVLAAGQSAHAAPADETNIVVIIDVTGSMSELSGSVAPGDPAKSKLDIGKLKALDWLINTAATTFTSPEYAVWEFSGDNHRLLQDFTSNSVLAVSAVGTSLQSTDATPLAGTICDAVDRLHDYEFDKTIVDPVTGVTRKARIDRRIYLVTDGLENNTAGTNECWGPGATTLVSYPNYDVGSWQWKALNKLKTGNANVVSSAPFEYIIDVEHILNDFIHSQNPLAANASAAAAEGLTGRFAAGTLPYSSVADDVNFFRGVASQSGGTYTQLAPDPQGVVSFKIPGDADGSRCVDMTDYDIFASVYGYPVDMANPATIQADFNADGWVDDLDYMLILQHWDEGC